MILITLRRTSIEDEVLRKEIGKQWEECAKRTPYKLLPFVFWIPCRSIAVCLWLM